MSNITQLVNKSKIIEDKLKIISDNLVADYQHGKIKTQEELLYKLFITLKYFYNSIGKPTMKLREFIGIPLESEYNNTIEEIFNDMSLLLNDCSNNTDVLLNMYNKVVLDKQQITNNINIIESLVDNLLYKSNTNDNKEILFDSFINLRNSDLKMAIFPEAYINTEYGYISLKTKSCINLNNDTTIEILDGSNGLPGNTHQINIINNNIKYEGENGLHITLADAIDNSIDTWFEYELFNISNDDLIKNLNLGFEYDEGIKWITEDNKLVLNLKISFKIPKIINTFTMLPYIPSNKDAIPSIIKNIKLYDGKGKEFSLLNNIEMFDKEKVYTFEKQLCSYIIIELEQPSTYYTLVGHNYFKEINNQNINYFEVNSLKYNKRVDGPKPSVKNLGLIYNSINQNYEQPKAKFGDKLLNSTNIKNNLFKQQAPQDLKMYEETIHAKRFCIGVKDISLSTYTYIEKSEYVSKEFITKEEIKSIELNSNHSIPNEFDKNKKWIKYFISINNGKEWEEIIPLGIKTNDNEINKILINSQIPKELRQNNIKYISTQTNVYSVRIKIILERPTDIDNSEYYSPIVYDYKLNIK